MCDRSRLERLERARRRINLGPAVLVVFPDDWPATDRAVLADGDPTLVDHDTGQRPGPRTRLIVVRRQQDGRV